MRTYATFASCFLYHLILLLHLVNIFMTGAYSSIQWSIYLKNFDIPTPPPLPLPPVYRAYLGLQNPNKTFKPYFS